MKKLVVLLMLMVSQVSLWSEEVFAFVTLLEEEKRELLKGSEIFNSSEEARFFQDIGISTFHHWVQTVRGHDFVIHLAKGDDLMCSFEALQSQFKRNDATAHRINQFYQTVLEAVLKPRL